MYRPDLAQAEIDELDAESYSNFLAFGDPPVVELPEDEYEAWLESHRIFDL